jgi:hypothetical protein
MLAVTLRPALAAAKSVYAVHIALAKLLAKVSIPNALALLVAWLARMIARVIIMNA